jgi:hypothetical protein
MHKACESSHRDVFDYLPITFVIDFSTDKQIVDQNYDKFQIYFNTIEKHKDQGIQSVNAAIATHPNL